MKYGMKGKYIQSAKNILVTESIQYCPCHLQQCVLVVTYLVFKVICEVCCK